MFKLEERDEEKGKFLKSRLDPALCNQMDAQTFLSAQIGGKNWGLRLSNRKCSPMEELIDWRQSKLEGVTQRESHA